MSWWNNYWNGFNGRSSCWIFDDNTCPMHVRCKCLRRWSHRLVDTRMDISTDFSNHEYKRICGGFFFFFPGPLAKSNESFLHKNRAPDGRRFPNVNSVVGFVRCPRLDLFTSKTSFISPAVPHWWLVREGCNNRPHVFVRFWRVEVLESRPTSSPRHNDVVHLDFCLGSQNGFWWFPEAIQRSFRLEFSLHRLRWGSSERGHLRAISVSLFCRVFELFAEEFLFFASVPV